MSCCTHNCNQGRNCPHRQAGQGQPDASGPCHRSPITKLLASPVSALFRFLPERRADRAGGSSQSALPRTQFTDTHQWTIK